MHLAIDVGRFAVKVVGANGYRDLFPSYVGEARNLRLTNNMRKTDIILKTTTGTYFIGDLAKDESHGGARIMTSNKVHNDTKLLALAAAARAVKDGDNISITTGLPVEYHKDQAKKEMADLLTGANFVEINGEIKRFVIKQVRVAVEGPSAYVSLCSGQGGIRRFVDLGSRTINYGVIINSRYIDRDSGTLDYGCDTVDADSGTFARRVVGDMSRRWPDLNAETYLLGGGATLCFTQLVPFFPRLVLAEDPQFANALAFYQIGEKAK